jgi:hypothetical protein
MILPSVAMRAIAPIECFPRAHGALPTEQLEVHLRSKCVWLRSLIPLPPGYGVAYVDWCQQEYGIAATQSGDEAMIRDYVSGDPYLQFAKEAGAVRPTPRRRATAISANSTSSVRLPSSMACRPKGWRGALASRRSSCAI